MIPKQSEMDAVVRQIYEAIENERHLQSTLLVLCGDHGMNEAGNHGGSAEGETSPALVFMSPKLRGISKGFECPIIKSETSFDYYQTVEQSDIAPTLAGLLGFPVPLNNLGVFIPELLEFWHEGLQDHIAFMLQEITLTGFLDVRLSLMQQNARQVLEIVRGTFSHLSFDEQTNSTDCSESKSDGEELSCLWLTAKRLLNTKQVSQTKISLAFMAVSHEARRHI